MIFEDNRQTAFTLAEAATQVDTCHIYRRVAFTLAEVLITLGIIGIVAAMTLPTILNNARNKELETGLKRAYSVIGQALDMYQAQNGERIKAGEIGSRKLKSILMLYFKVIEDCGNGHGDSNTACIPSKLDGIYDKDKAKNRQFMTYNGKTEIVMSLFDDGQFVINDGSLILLENSGSNILISVDVNGYNKNPNRLGQDLFMFQIDNTGKLLPMGVKGTNYYSETDAFCSATSTSSINGAGCTYNALTNKNYFKNLPK